VTFTYEAIETFEVTIEFDTGNPDQPQSVHHHIVTQNKSAGVAGALASEARRTGQYTGWNLLGFDGEPVVEGDDVPVVGDSCPNGNLGCVVTAVTPLSSTGGLYAHWNGNKIHLQ
jgi:hypothetical protein